MFDSTIHAGTLARHFRKADFHSTAWSAAVSDKADILDDALRIAASGFLDLKLHVSQRGGKPVYRHGSLAEALLTRHVSEMIRRVTNVRQSDRQSIVKSLIQLSSEGVSFGVLKMDIKSFYESVKTDDLVQAIRLDPAFSRQTVSTLSNFFEALKARQIYGLPRGVGLSATLAEYAMRSFDAGVSSIDGMRYYSRYVDDAIALTTSNIRLDELQTTASALLPTGLVLNRVKTNPFAFRPYTKANNGSVENVITFLGYIIRIHQALSTNGRICRKVEVDIAPRKVTRIKYRVARSLYQFKSNGSFDELRDRIKLLSSNFVYHDYNTGQKRFSGLRYNYSLINPETSAALDQLDRFLINTITSKHAANRLRPNLTRAQQRQLLGFGFRSGFTENRFFAFEDEQLEHLIRCWSHA